MRPPPLEGIPRVRQLLQTQRVAVLATEEILHLVLVATAQALSHSQDYEDALAVISLAQNLKTDMPPADVPPV